MKNTENKSEYKDYTLFLCLTLTHRHRHRHSRCYCSSEWVRLYFHSFIHSFIVLFFVFRYVAVFPSTFFVSSLARFFSFNPIVSVHLCVHSALENRLTISKFTLSQNEKTHGVNKWENGTTYVLCWAELCYSNKYTIIITIIIA